MFDEGQERIESELDVVNIMKKLNRLDTLVKKHLPNKEQRFIAKHSKKRVIDLDSDEEPPMVP